MEEESGEDMEGSYRGKVRSARGWKQAEDRKWKSQGCISQLRKNCEPTNGTVHQRGADKQTGAGKHCDIAIETLAVRAGSQPNLNL
jgi:hypothetical protein